MNTYSIVARDAAKGQLGVAVQSRWFSVGSGVLWAEPGIGAVATQSLFETRGRPGCQGSDPIFIVGMPRAGSTLLEQILASHSMVDGTMELHEILGPAQRLRGRSVADSSAYPRNLWDLEDNYFERFGDKFISDTRAYRRDAPHFVDKMPNNFMHIGLIRLILPNAKIIDARRHPMACGFSCFKPLFGEGQACLEFHRTERSIKTPSSEQVRQPIYRTGLDYWRNDESWLGPLKEALGKDVRQRFALNQVTDRQPSASH